ncbi:hypothetical protein BBK82_35795 [Lentzea guizhouensis]|uniref:Uncharacterized protein n=1 Tax=Lentzea guizhouensis TaxID=1586287 RepID=A0A1B2HS38_9PSEU|nr:hypothetical protein BBK82_35795 [Lentzea guizhouensis]
MFVVVPVMDGMAVAVVHVVHVITMRDSHMAAARTVIVTVVRVRLVIAGFALVDMSVVLPVEVAVVRVVDVITVRDGHMAAPVAVGVAVVGVFEVCRGHDQPASRRAGLHFTRTF